jgi:DNA-directed RNA polymerase subunit RPC12/RpoP
MRIIQSGIPWGNRWARGSCSNCDAVVEAQLKELQVTNDYRLIDDQNINGERRLGDCPSCGHKMDFPLLIDGPSSLEGNQSGFSY